MPIDWSALPDKIDPIQDPALGKVTKPLSNTMRRVNTEQDRGRIAIASADKSALNAIPFLGVSAVEGLWSMGGIGKAAEDVLSGVYKAEAALLNPVYKAVGLGEIKPADFNTSKLIREAVEYWRARTPAGSNVPDIQITYEEDGLGIRQIEYSTRELAGTVAEMTGAIPAIGTAMKAGSLVTEAAVKARPFFQRITTGMIGGALLGEGKPEQTLENMALFGAFEGLAYALGRVSRVPRQVAESQWYRKMTIKERGLAIQTLDKAVANSQKYLELMKQRGASKETLEYLANMTEAKLARSVNDKAWREKQVAKQREAYQARVREQEVKAQEKEARVREQEEASKGVSAQSESATQVPRPKTPEEWTKELTTDATLMAEQLSKANTSLKVAEILESIDRYVEGSQHFIELAGGEPFVLKRVVQIAKEKLRTLTEKETGLSYEDATRQQLNNLLTGKGAIGEAKKGVLVKRGEVPEITTLDKELERLIHAAEVKVDPPAHEASQQRPQQTIPSAKGQDKVVESRRTTGIETFKDIETAALKKTSREVENELRARTAYIKKLRADAEMVKRGDAKFAESTLLQDSEYKYDLRVVEEELKIFEALVGGVDKKPKTTIDKVSGKTKVKTVVSVDERIALKDQIRLEAKAAREAFRAGRNEAAMAAKVRQKELLEAHRDRVKLKQRIDAALKVIRRRMPSTVDYAYVEAIENLRKNIDPNFRSRSVLLKRKSQEEYVKRFPQAAKEIPRKVKRVLGKKPLNDFSVEDLEDLAATIKLLEDLGKMEREHKLAEKKAEIEGIVGEAEKSILAGEAKKKDADIPKIKANEAKDSWKRRLRQFRAATLRPYAIADMLDGFKDFGGAVHRFLIDRTNARYNAKLQSLDSRNSYIKKAFDDTGMTIAKLAEVREVQGSSFSVSEMIHIYAGWKNTYNRLALRFGNNITTKLHNAVVKSLSSAEKRFGDYILSELKNNFPRYRDAIIKNENRGVVEEDNYLQMSRMEVQKSTSIDDIKDMLEHRDAYANAYARKGNSISRKDILDKYQKPIRLGIYEEWVSGVENQEQYIHFADHLKDIHNFVDNPRLKEALEQRGGEYGKEYIKSLRSYVNRVADPNIYKSFHWTENLSRTLRNNVALYYLGASPLVMARQFPSVLAFLPDSGTAAMGRAFAEFTKNSAKVWQFVNKEIPQIRHRMIERDIEELKNLQGSKYNRIMKKVGDVVMAGIRAIDGVAIRIGSYAVYLNHVEKLGHDAAILKAEKSFLRTQPQAATKDLPEIYATNEFLNWLLQFTNQLNQYYVMESHTMRGYAKRGEWDRVVAAAFAISLSALVIWGIGHKRLPRNKEEMAEVFIDQHLNELPLIGKSLVQGVHGYDSDIPPLKGLSDVGKGLSDANIEQLIRGIAPLVGVPAGKQMGRILDAAESGDVMDLLGGKAK